MFDLMRKKKSSQNKKLENSYLLLPRLQKIYGFDFDEEWKIGDVRYPTVDLNNN